MPKSQFSAGNFCVVTNCTARKSGSGGAVTLPVAFTGTSVQALARGWVEATRQAVGNVEARSLYLGRAFREGRLAADSIGASLFVVSAGFGLVSGATRIPNYNLTVSDGPGSIRPHLRTCKDGAAGWWRELNLVLGSPTPLSELVAGRTFDHVFLAMPSTYLSMVAEDLAALPASMADKLRIFTSRSGLSVLPVNLRSCVLPYDERLEAVAGFAGTQIDFAQRALRHFVEVVGGHRLPMAKAIGAVDSCLGAPAKLRRTAGAKVSDSEIQRLLLANWETSSGSSTKLLRFLRDEARVACEQKRFQRIWLAASSQHHA